MNSFGVCFVDESIRIGSKNPTALALGVSLEKIDRTRNS